MNIELQARSYHVARDPNELVQVDVSFVLMTPPHNVQDVAEALKRIEIFLSGSKVNLVKSDGSMRCFYCGTKQDNDATTCSQCGAPL